MAVVTLATARSLALALAIALGLAVAVAVAVAVDRGVILVIKPDFFFMCAPGGRGRPAAPAAAARGRRDTPKISGREADMDT